MHYYHIDGEAASRSGNGGKINPGKVWLLQDAIREVYRQHNNNKNKPYLSIVSDTNETFWDARGEIIHKFRTTRKENDKNRYKYFPYKAFAYKYPSTMDNVVKQWHSIDAVWNSMEKHIKLNRMKQYNRVAMIRNDVLYVEPIDLYSHQNKNNSIVSIPNFANHPVNDRMVVGPYSAVKVWATQRFAQVEYQVNTYKPAGFGIHSERMMSHAILPLMREKYNCTIQPDNRLCFLRVRADGAIWLHDCNNGYSKYEGDVKQRLLEMIKSSPDGKYKHETSLFPHICDKKMLHNNLPQVYCPPIYGATHTRSRNGTTSAPQETMDSLVSRLWKLNIAYAKSTTSNAES
jgi:hypothetical protein